MKVSKLRFKGYKSFTEKYAAINELANIFAGGQKSLCYFPNGKWIKNGYFGTY